MAVCQYYFLDVLWKCRLLDDKRPYNLLQPTHSSAHENLAHLKYYTTKDYTFDLVWPHKSSPTHINSVCNHWVATREGCHMTLGATWQVTKATLINMAHQFRCHTNEMCSILLYFTLITIFVNLGLFRHFETVTNTRTWIKSHRYWRML